MTAHSSPQAFQLSTGLISQEGIQLNWKMLQGTYLYQKFIKIISLDPNIIIGAPAFPKGEIKNTQLFGKVTVYHNDLTLNIPIENPNHQSTMQLKLSYQGCSEQGQCFPPITEILTINLDTQSTTIENTNPFYANSNTSSNTPPLNNETNTIEQSLEKKSFIFALGGFFILGLLLSVTPCVLPMIPILSSIILYGYENKSTSKAKAFGLSLTYVIGMSLAYASLGFLMSFAGSRVQSFFQSSYIILSFALIFIVLALSLLGFFDIRWFNTSNHKFTQLNQRLAKIACKNHFTLLGMGFLSALIVSPCITPPLVGALSYITTTGNFALGTTALFIMGLGLGFPLLFIGVLGNNFLPKAGRWMDNIKFLMGILLFGIAIFLFQRLVPHYAFLLWSIFSILLFILLLYRFDFQTSWKRTLFQAFCFIGIVSSGIYIIHNTLGTSQTESYITISNTTQLNHYLHLAKKEHKPVIVDFYADWCPDCQLMETQVFNQSEIQKLLTHFIWIKVDMTDDSQDIWDLQEKYSVTGPPTFLFYASNGSHLKEFDFVGMKSEKNMVKILADVKEKHTQV